MLFQAKISAPDTLLTLYAAIDEDLKALRPLLRATQLSRDPRGEVRLSVVEVLTLLGWGAWRGLNLFFRFTQCLHCQGYHVAAHIPMFSSA